MRAQRPLAWWMTVESLAGGVWGCVQLHLRLPLDRACSKHRSRPYRRAPCWLLFLLSHFWSCSDVWAGLLWILEAFLLPSLMDIAAPLFSVQQAAGHLPDICVSPPPPEWHAVMSRDLFVGESSWSSIQSRTQPTWTIELYSVRVCRDDTPVPWTRTLRHR